MNPHAPLMTRRLLLLASAVVLLLVWFVGFASGDTVALRSEAEFSGGPGGVTLGDVAALEGPYAQALAGVVVRAWDGKAAPPKEIHLRDVRAALGAAGVNWARVSLKGYAVCAVRVDPAAVPVEAPSTPPAVAEPTPRTTTAAEALVADGTVAALLETTAESDTPATVRGLIERVLREGLGQPADQVSIEFERSDAELLEASTLGTAYEIEPIGRVRLGAMNLRLRRVAGYGQEAEHLVRVRVTWRTRVVVAADAIQRHERLGANNLAMQEVVLDRPTVSHLFELDAARGSVCGTSLRPGQPVLREHLGLPVLVKRGDRVTVQMIHRGFRIDATGFAESDAALHESVVVRLDSRRRRDTPTLTGVVTGLGRVSVDATPAPAPEPASNNTLASGA